MLSDLTYCSKSSYKYNQLSLSKVKYLANLLSLILVLISIVLFPKNNLVFILNFMSFIINFINSHRITKGAFIVLWGGAIWGNLIMSLFGFYWEDVGYLFFVMFGIFILFMTEKELAHIREEWHLPLSWLLIIYLVLVFSFFLGPMSKYSYDKLLHVLIKTPLAIIAFRYVIKAKKNVTWEIGTLVILSSFLLYSLQVYLYPEYAPSNILENAGLRAGSFKLQLMGETFKFATNEISYLACVGLSLILPNTYRSRSHNTLTFFYLLIALIIINSSGQRLFYLLPLLIVLLSLIILKRASKIKSHIFVTIVFVTLMVMYAISRQIEVFGWDYKIILNRSLNWDSALVLFKEKPFFGYGLGGFYIKGISFPGMGLYPHNIFLELLVETGMVGTVIILGYVFACFIIPQFKQFVFFKTITGTALLPLGITLLVTSLISFDLRFSYLLFSFIIAIWAFTGKRYGMRYND